MRYAIKWRVPPSKVPVPGHVIRGTALFSGTRWVAEHLVMSGPADLSLPRATSDEPGYDATYPRRYAQ